MAVCSSQLKYKERTSAADALVNQHTPYVVISPVRNEAQYIEHTLRSMVSQTVPPKLWILVDDGSSDGTAGILDTWAAQYSWIRAIHLPDRSQVNSAIEPDPSEKRETGRGRRAQQAKEIEAFYQGFQTLEITDWDFLVKLDGDLSFGPDYFEKCFKEFESDPKLGIGGGAISNLVDGNLQFEPTREFHVRGATKIYRRNCWNDMGGVLRGAAWDTIDEVKANMLGWQTRSFPSLTVTHHRFTGAANGMWQNAVKNGTWSYICGYHPLFMVLRCFKRLLKKPVFVGSVGLMYGYMSAFLQQIPQVEDRSVLHYLREQQLRKLSFRSSIWR